MEVYPGHLSEPPLDLSDPLPWPQPPPLYPKLGTNIVGKEAVRCSAQIQSNTLRSDPRGNQRPGNVSTFSWALKTFLREDQGHERQGPHLFPLPLYPQPLGVCLAPDKDLISSIEEIHYLSFGFLFILCCWWRSNHGCPTRDARAPEAGTQ